MNNVTLVGRIGKDPETKTFEDGNVKVSFSLATSEKYKDKAGEWKDATEWHNIVLFRETKMRKGDLVEVIGKIKTRSWDNKEGVKQYITEIVAHNLTFLNRPGETAQQRPTQQQESNNSDAGNLPEDDLPF